MSLIPKYSINTAMQFNATFYDVNGNLTDPSNVVFSTAGSDGVSYAFPAVRASQGVYSYTFTTTTPVGYWYFRFQGTGTANIQSLDAPYIVEPTYF
jgi:hypothetical protein